MDKRILVSDTSVLINFLKINRMDLIGEVSYEFFVTEHVSEEITTSYIKEYNLYQKAIDEGSVSEIALTSHDELELFAKLSTSGRIGLGECSAIAYAICRDCSLAIDDRIATREAESEYPGISILRTQDLIVLMISEGLVSIAEADRLRDEWRNEHRFHIQIESFEDLLP